MNEQLIVALSPYIETVQGMKSPERVKAKTAGTISEQQKKFFEAAIKAWEEYKSSPEGLMLEESIKASDYPAIQQKISEIMDSSPFVALKKLMDMFGIDAASFSIGFEIEVEFIIGIAATIGVAIGVGNSKGVSSSEFISVAFDEGIDEGALVAVQFGLWTSAPADLGGYAWGTEVDLGMGAEVGGVVYYSSKGSILGVTVSVGAGEEDGIDEQESYTFILGSQEGDGGGYLKPAYQPKKNNLLIISNVHCTETQGDGIGNANEVYFTFQADGTGTTYHYPTYDYFSMEKGDTWACGRSIWLDNAVVVKLYDEDDWPNDPDLLATFTIHLSDLSTTTTKTYSSTANDCKYSIDVKLLAQNVEN